MFTFATLRAVQIRVLRSAAAAVEASTKAAPLLLNAGSETTKGAANTTTAPLPFLHTEEALRRAMAQASHGEATHQGARPRVALVKKSVLLSVLVPPPAQTAPAGHLAAPTAARALLPMANPHSSLALAQLASEVANAEPVSLAEAAAPRAEALREQRAAQHVPLNREQQLPPLSPAGEELFAAARENDVERLRRALTAITTTTTTSSGSTTALAAELRHPQHGGTALHVAAQLGFVAPNAVADVLLAAGADVNARARNGATPLHWAAGAGQEEAARWLLARGADPSCTTLTWGACIFGRGSGQTATHWAAESGHTAVLALLAAHAHPALLVQPDERDQTPLALARREIRFDTAAYLAREEAEEYLAVEFSSEVQTMEALLPWQPPPRGDSS